MLSYFLHHYVGDDLGYTRHGFSARLGNRIASNDIHSFYSLLGMFQNTVIGYEV